jgi:multiple sugar transport system permease protein
MRRQENLLGWLLASPWIIGFSIIMVGPMIFSLGLSFTDWNLLSTPVFNGLDNYRKMFFEDELVGQSLKVTLYYAAGSLPLGLIGSLAVAMLLNAKIKGLAAFRAIYYLPAVLSGVATAQLWRFVFSPEFGLLNELLAKVGIQGPNWLMSTEWVVPSLILMSLWHVGGSMVIYLAALQGVPTELYEASIIDGAGWFQKILYVTLPMISPVILFQVIMGIIGSLQAFVTVAIMTNGGPANASLFYMLHLYRQGFEYFRMGYAAALAWLLFFIIMGLSLLVLRSSTAWVYYEAEIKGR